MKLRAGLAVLFMTVLAGCTVGPKYAKPTVPAPLAYKEGGGWKTGQPSDASVREKWWELFSDPQLNALQERLEPANQNLKIAIAHYQEARAAIRFNRAALFPTVSAGPSIANEHLSANRLTSVGNIGLTGGDFTLPIDASYEVDLWGRVRRAIASAREEAQASEADLETLKLSLHSELALDYYEARNLDAQKKILDDNVAAYQKALDLTQNRFDGGIASKSEVAQARTQLNSTQAQDIDVGVARSQYEHAIAVLLGSNPESFNLPPLPLNQAPPDIPVGVPSQLLERRPDIAAAERRVAEANEQIGIARAAFFPQLLLTATGGLEGGNIVNWFNWPSRFWAVGPQMVQTIFDAGRRRAVSESAQAGYSATIANYRQTALQAFQDVEDNLAALRILDQEAKKQHEATQSAENSLELSTNRYKGGLVTYLEVITAQTIALTNERTEADILRRRMDASVLLIKALGGGWDLAKLPQS